MRFSQLFGQTLREAPADAVTASHKLLVRASYLRRLESGLFAMLPLGQRSLEKIAALARRSLQAHHGQEIGLPADIAPNTAELASLVGREVQSYKHLPRVLYALQNQPQADFPPSGLLPGRVSLILTLLGLVSGARQRDQLSRDLTFALDSLLARCGVQALGAPSAPAELHSSPAQSLFFPTEAGETPLLSCDLCGNTYTQFAAPFRRPYTPPETPLPVNKAFTPNCKTIADLADFLNVPRSKTAKAILLVARMGKPVREQFVFVVVRGDTDMSETKLAAALEAVSLRPATEDEIRAVGAVPGFASPVGLKSVFVIVDKAIAETPNLVSGANQPEYHLLNINYGRDYTAQVVADIAAAPDDASCPDCAAPMRRFFATQVARVTTYGEGFNDPAGCSFLDRDGKPGQVHMTTAMLDLVRVLACAAEQHLDERGLALPISIAPYQVHLVALKGGFTFAEQLYANLAAAGVEVLFDDRDESPGVKFNDADLIGLPIRLTVAEKSLAQGGVEFKLRRESERRVVSSAQVVDEVLTSIRALESAQSAGSARNLQ